ADNFYASVPFDADHLANWAHGFALGSLAAARAFTRAWTPHVIHGHDWIAALQTRSLAAYLNVPHVMTIHATEYGRHNGWLTSALSKIVYSRELHAIQSTPNIIVCSNYMKAELTNGYAGNPNRMTVIPNGVSTPTDKPANEDTDVSDTPSDIFTVGFIGRVEWEKGVHHIIDALILLPKGRFRLVIVGTGSQVPSLRAKIERKGLSDHVTFLGYVSSQEKTRLLSTFDAVVVPSSYEPFGIVALEAGAARVPLVTSSAGGLRDVVPNGSYGYPLVQVDGESIAAALKSIQEFPHQADEKASRLAHRVREEYSWTFVVEKTDSVYVRAIEEYGA
ncbi:MAG: glycosyltransferase family 4 protein, partial [Candidatus Nanopelagicales bacterium]|nr:glycosyltransferase family 4 protein [Candidatus Nanopelagicales bacterium]